MNRTMKRRNVSKNPRRQQGRGYAELQVIRTKKGRGAYIYIYVTIAPPAAINKHLNWAETWRRRELMQVNIALLIDDDGEEKRHQISAWKPGILSKFRLIGILLLLFTALGSTSTNANTNTNTNTSSCCLGLFSGGLSRGGCLLFKRKKL